MEVVLLLTLLSVGSGAGRRVSGRTGGSVTLPCRYDVERHGALSVCWNRGEIPSSKCDNQIISTDGRTAPRAPSRYQLLGALGAGDVSLTILNVTQTDAGRYGCRVEIPGWFNDDKHHFDLAVEQAPQTTTTTRPGDAGTPTQRTPGQTTVTRSSGLTSSSSSSITAEMSLKQSGSGSVVLVAVLFALVALVTAGAVAIFSKKWRRINKILRQQTSSSVSNLRLQSRSSAPDNVYQIDEGGDGGEYEHCP